MTDGIEGTEISLRMKGQVKGQIYRWNTLIPSLILDPEFEVPPRLSGTPPPNSRYPPPEFEVPPWRALEEFADSKTSSKRFLHQNCNLKSKDPEFGVPLPNWRYPPPNSRYPPEFHLHDFEIDTRPADFRKSDKVTKKYQKIDVTP